MHTSSMNTLRATSYLSAGNADYIEELYELFLKDPQALPSEWRNYFQSLPKINGYDQDVSHAAIRQQLMQLAQQRPKAAALVSGDALLEKKQANVERLIDNYRRYGHLAAKIDPLHEERALVPELNPGFEHLDQSDLQRQFHAPALVGSPTASSLKDILQTLQTIYCGSLGFEYMYVANQQERLWLQHYIETTRGRLTLTTEEKRQLLWSLTAADGLEKYLGTKFVGQKRFSLEGGDTLIPMLQRLVQHSSAQKTNEIVIGMAHRGRLNVLVNVFGKPSKDLFAGFEGKKIHNTISGDVKYHLGYSSDVKTPSGLVHLSLAFNPSHLEIIAPVAVGSVRARQDHLLANREQGLAVIIHGDAAFAGQGVVMETLNMSQVNAYKVGGTIHIVVNNQVGFTTSEPRDARSTTYCTDIAKMIDAPVFHVNNDDPEAALFAMQLAADYQATFHKDVVIDLVCFRRHGHNEADEPAATQPLMYQKIKSHPATREVYAKQLETEGLCTPEEGEQLFLKYRDLMDQGKAVIPTVTNGVTEKRKALWQPFLAHNWRQPVQTAVPREKLLQLGQQLTQFPKDFEMQRQVGLAMATRTKMLTGELPLDWGSAEILAYATLLQQGYNIRMTGQDCQRGTFAHRHAVLHDQQTDKTYMPLDHLGGNQGRFAIHDSLLSEEAVLAFEYGYSATDPKTLVLWEAQYGDFANGAQVVADQFISSAWQKWARLSGLVMLLPHGYEGGGPEHSSARLERYLQLCAQDNMQVCVPTTPAQIFHLLRRQILQPLRVPLIIMSPKSLLRHKQVVSTFADLANGSFNKVISEIENVKPDKVRQVVFCSGKVYYDLQSQRAEKKQQNVAILRIEQLHPFPQNEIKTQLRRYKQAKEIVWCQEEPQNQGAWYFVQPYLLACLDKQQSLRYAGREASAATATGYHSEHIAQQEALLKSALN
jgi:2-oxoglutarate dehydrogenase E1 component